MKQNNFSAQNNFEGDFRPNVPSDLVNIINYIPGASEVLGLFYPEIQAEILANFPNFSLHISARIINKPQNIWEFVKENKYEMRDALVYKPKGSFSESHYYIVIPNIGIYIGSGTMLESGDIVPDGSGEITFNANIQGSRGFLRLIAKFTNGKIRNSTDIKCFRYGGNVYYTGGYKRDKQLNLHKNGGRWQLWVPHGYGALKYETQQPSQPPYFIGKFEYGRPIYANYFYNAVLGYYYQGYVLGQIFYESTQNANSPSFMIFPQGKGHLVEVSYGYEIMGQFNNGVPVSGKAGFVNEYGLFDGEFHGLMQIGQGSWWIKDALKSRNKHLYFKKDRIILNGNYIVSKKGSVQTATSSSKWFLAKSLFSIKGYVFRLMKKSSYNIYSQSVPFTYTISDRRTLNYWLWRLIKRNSRSTNVEHQLNNGIGSIIKSPFKDARFLGSLHDNNFPTHHYGELQLSPNWKKYGIDRLVYQGWFINRVPKSDECILKISDKGIFMGQYQEFSPHYGVFTYNSHKNLSFDEEAEFRGIFKKFQPYEGEYIISRKDLFNTNGTKKEVIIEYEGRMLNFLPHGHGKIVVYSPSKMPGQPKRLGTYEGKFKQGDILSRSVESMDDSEILSEKNRQLMRKFSQLPCFTIDGVGKYYGSYKDFIPNGIGFIQLDENYKPGFSWFIGKVEGNTLFEKKGKFLR